MAGFPEYDWGIDIDGAGPVTLRAAAAGRFPKLGFIEVTVDADATIDVYHGTNSAANRVLHLKVKAGSGVSRTPIALGKRGPDNTALIIATSAGSLTGHASGWDS